jgi:serine/threonine kinase 16
MGAALTCCKNLLLIDEAGSTSPRPESSYTVDGRELAVVRQLGEGGYAFVFLVRDAEGKQYALKRLTINSRSARAAALEEAECHRRFRHASILPLLGCSQHQPANAPQPRGGDAEELPLQHLMLLLPLHAEGSLQDVVDEVKAGTGRLCADALVLLFVQLGFALQVLHSHSPPYAHRDVKPANLLLTGWRRLLRPLSEDTKAPPPGRSGQTLSAVLCDFGSCRPAALSPAALARGRAAAAAAAVEAAAAECSALYRAPELYQCREPSSLDERVDIWALGCTLYASMSGCSPFEYALAQGGSVSLAVLSGKVRWPDPGDSGGYPAELVQLARDCMEHELALRPRIGEVLGRLQAMEAAPPWRGNAGARARAAQPDVAAGSDAAGGWASFE